MAARFTERQETMVDKATKEFIAARAEETNRSHSDVGRELIALGIQALTHSHGSAPVGR